MAVAPTRGGARHHRLSKEAGRPHTAFTNQMIPASHWRVSSAARTEVPTRLPARRATDAGSAEKLARAATVRV